MAIDLPVCESCDHAVFPPRLACPHCGSRAWRTTAAEYGALQHVTVVRRSPVVSASGAPVWLGLVRTDVGPVLIVRVDENAEPGDRVQLSANGSALIARPAQSQEGVAAG
jgi:uncharacterized OB-fold protein